MTIMFSAMAMSDVIDLQFAIDGSQTVPPTDTTGHGSGTATFDTDTLEFSWNFEYADLEGDPVGAHFHGAASYCQNAGIQVPLTLDNPNVGSTTVSQQQADDILAGLWYVNIHTDLHPAGEIRGQVELAPLDDPIPSGIPLGERVRLTPVATGLAAPNWGAAAPGIDGRLYVTDQNGIVWNINIATGEKTVFLDLSDRLVPLGLFGDGTYDERGLLGIAFHPDYQQNGLLYTYTSEPFDPNDPADFSTMPVGATPNHVSVIAEWNVPTPNDPDAVVNPSSIRVVLRIDQPQFNHNAGAMDFGPDGMLYVTLGDGGNADDQDTGTDPFGEPNLGHGCDGNGQSIQTILGGMIRIDPLGNNSANGEYGIPADNPFAGMNAVEELYAYGMRNPFRFSFDMQTGDIYLTDTGQNDIEEVDVINAGENYGWNLMEGSFRFVRNGAEAGYVVEPTYLDTSGLTMPIAEYDHDEGIAIVGGFVYRGENVPSLDGHFIFGDLARTFQSDGRLFYLDGTNSIQEFDVVDGPFGRFLLGFGEDANGEIYVMANSTGIPFEQTGEVLRIDPPLLLEKTGDCPGRVDLTVTGASPGSRIAFVRARRRGTTRVPGGIICGGTVLSLDRSATLVTTVRADGNGTASIGSQVPAQVCGSVVVQAVELGNSDHCATSNVVTIE